jgi:uncharacterized membrane protein
MLMKLPDSDNDFEKWLNDPHNWRVGGIFYFNPKDKRLVVLKRKPWMGLTINFAHPMAFALVLFTVLWILFVGFLPALFKK